MCAKPLTPDTVSSNIAAFLDTADKTPVRSEKSTGRLIFAMDATASRSPTWDMAMSIQADMFSEASALGGLEVQLVYYRGLMECRSSSWTRDASELGRLMSKVDVLAGRTQIERVLKHALKEAGTGAVNALVFIGDAMEENVDLLADAAGQLGLRGVPVFMFHEGGGEPAASAFKHIAKVSGGAYCLFDASSPGALRALLRAVAAFAAGGARALEDYGRKHGGSVLQISEQMTGR
ncbi:MAG: VWA domain-containing protein [Alphaproteobacteria bacterium]|nr:VWA domain-containing protein [Alphaproteobacteria bacterium]